MTVVHSKHRCIDHVLGLVLPCFMREGSGNGPEKSLEAVSYQCILHCALRSLRFQDYLAYFLKIPGAEAMLGLGRSFARTEVPPVSRYVNLLEAEPQNLETLLDGDAEAIRIPTPTPSWPGAIVRAEHLTGRQRKAKASNLTRARFVWHRTKRAAAERQTLPPSFWGRCFSRRPALPVRASA